MMPLKFRKIDFHKNNKYIFFSHEILEKIFTINLLESEDELEDMEQDDDEEDEDDEEHEKKQAWVKEKMKDAKEGT